MDPRILRVKNGNFIGLEKPKARILRAPKVDVNGIEVRINNQNPAARMLGDSSWGPDGVDLNHTPQTNNFIIGQGPVLWSILIPTITERAKKLEVLIAELSKQARLFCEDLGKSIEIICLSDNRVLPSGFKRWRLLQLAKGEFVNFVDDDDSVDSEYIRVLGSEILKDFDSVSYNIRRTVDGENPEIHEFRVENKTDQIKKLGVTGYMFNHLCLIRKSKALGSFFPPIGYNDDVVWYKILYLKNNWGNTKHVDKVLYNYDFSWAGTANQSSDKVRAKLKIWGKHRKIYEVLKPVVFEGRVLAPGELVFETSSLARSVTVRDRSWRLWELPKDILKLLGQV